MKYSINDTLPDYSFRNIEGNPVRLGDVAGGRTALVVFYRGWW
ncbi:MAG TPA: hypothetical protein PKM65_17080 [Spirochaetota bacterium]|nr:hypothetical protein [Spirochaetota bacterium]HNT12181.1 hypothetical protein [Spirochaetota bacterium]HNV48032.1 hypothetical protein [Spirochaetota bacterium]HOS40445.1 hypothetical protein [Spirochaetota bacterium]HPI23573.1 hypothetical protein [Spirochaetota bacterium]